MGRRKRSLEELALNSSKERGRKGLSDASDAKRERD
jgi:hypothetical protein